MHAPAFPLVLLTGCLLQMHAAGQAAQPGTAPAVRLPADHPKIAAAQPVKKAFDLAARAKSHWAWQPLRAPEAPPSSRYSHPVDRFLDAARRARGLTAAPRASRASLVRRAYFDVTGLPPSRAELERWQHAGDDFLPRLVDELLASRQYGEHWARHWLDLVRYSETMGHEFDYSIPNAWMYRDYLIRALNADVPYDQLVTEHLAGDLMPNPRRDPATGANESIKGTISYWFVEQAHSPVDNHRALANRIDNQIDVITKSFLGLTVSCARCHDHKFDAISQKDYYALYGVQQSSRFTLASTASPAKTAELVPRMRQASRSLAHQVARTVDPGGVTHLLLRAREQMLVEKRKPSDDAQLEAWIRALADARLRRDREHPMYAWAVLTNPPKKPAPKSEGAKNTKSKKERQRAIDGPQLSAWLQRRSRELVAVEPRSVPAAQLRLDDVVFADFDTGSDGDETGFEGWFVDGNGLGGGPIESPIHVVPGRYQRAFVRFREGRWADSASVSLLADATLHSPTFTIDKRYVHVLAEGRASRVNCVIDGFNLIRSPIYGGLKQRLDTPTPRWYTLDLARWKGRPAYLQFVDARENDLAGPGGGNDGYFAVQKVVFSDDRAPRQPAAASAREMLGGAPVASFIALASRYSKAIHDACDAYRAGHELTPTQHAILDWLGANGLLRADGALLASYKQLEAELPHGKLIPGMRDGSPATPHVFLRGNHKAPGDAVARRFLTALGGRKFTETGSGRLDLAHEITRPDNPLASRVIVNRIWQHVFGVGLVATVDNLGALGDPPSHPELLDWLARKFIADGWSIKAMIRLLMTSEAYRMASRPDPKGAGVDPTNRWLSHANKRRLTGEEIRDAMLEVSGRLDPKGFGPPVPVHLTEFMDGRGRPRSGPVDGNGRRSIYLAVRRNFLNPFFLAFDTPQPFTTIGRRGTSNVPAQALALMNDPLVAELARVWAKSVLGHQNWSDAQRIEDMYLGAFARAPTAAEVAAATRFLARHSGRTSEQDWADLAHVLFQVKEFIYID